MRVTLPWLVIIVVVAAAADAAAAAWMRAKSSLTSMTLEHYQMTFKSSL